MDSGGGNVAVAQPYTRYQSRDAGSSRFVPLIHSSILGFSICAALLAPGATAQSPPQFQIPQNITQCNPVNVTWTGGIPPYDLSIIPLSLNGMQNSGQVESFNVVGTSFLWTPNFPAGTPIQFDLVDNGSDGPVGGVQVILADSNDSCLDKTTSSQSSTATTRSSSTSPLPQSSTTTLASSMSTSPQSSTATQSSSTSPPPQSLTATGPSSTSTSPQSSTATPTSSTSTSSASSASTSPAIAASKKVLSTGAIVGITVAIAVCAIAAVVLAIWYGLRRRNRGKSMGTTDIPNADRPLSSGAPSDTTAVMTQRRPLLSTLASGHSSSTAPPTSPRPMSPTDSVFVSAPLSHDPDLLPTPFFNQHPSSAPLSEVRKAKNPAARQVPNSANDSSMDVRTPDNAPVSHAPQAPIGSEAGGGGPGRVLTRRVESDGGVRLAGGMNYVEGEADVDALSDSGGSTLPPPYSQY